MKKMSSIKYIQRYLFFCFALPLYLISFVNAERPIAPQELIGNWRLDSSRFVNNNVKKEKFSPLVDTVWTFSQDGIYKSSANKISGTYTLDGKIIKIKAMNMNLEYTIEKLNARTLVLILTISPTIQTIQYMTKVK